MGRKTAILVAGLVVIAAAIAFIGLYQRSRPALEVAAARAVIEEPYEVLYQSDLGWTAMYLVKTSAGYRTVFCDRGLMGWTGFGVSRVDGTPEGPVRTLALASYERTDLGRGVTFLAVEVARSSVAYIEAGTEGRRIRQPVPPGGLVYIRWDEAYPSGLDLSPLALSADGEVLYEYGVHSEGGKVSLPGDLQWLRPGAGALLATGERSTVAVAADAPPDNGAPFVSWDTSSTVPFLFTKDAPGGSVGYYLGLWDISKGTVTCGDKQLFSVLQPCRVFWDGSERFVLAPADAKQEALDVVVEDRRLVIEVPELAFSLPSGFGSLLVVPPGRQTAIAAYRRPAGGAVLEVEGGTLEGTMDLNPPAGVEVGRPVAIEAASASSVVVYVDASGSQDSAGRTLSSILAATWDGREVSWRVVAQDLDINEAGAGSRMAKHGNQLAISDYRGVRLLDLSTGEVQVETELAEAQSSFLHEFVSVMEYAAPAVPASYRDLLLLQWDIPFVEDKIEDGEIIYRRSIPTFHLAAVRDGHVVGEVKRVGDRIWVVKDGQKTKDISLEPEEWILPR